MSRLDAMADEQKSYPLPPESLPGLRLSDHLSDLVQIKEFIESRGVQIKNTRIERYIQYLEIVSNGQKVDESLIFKNSVDERFRISADWLLYVLREIHELMWILKGLKTTQPAGLDEKLKVIVSGSDFAALDTNPQCRNFQFELRIASYFCQAGFQVDLTTKTQVIALGKQFAFFIECKSVASMVQLSRRISEAKKQLRQRMPNRYHDLPAYGCIAVDVTKVAFSHNGLTFGLTPEHSKDIIQAKLKGIASAITRTPILVGSNNILQCWLQIYIPCLVIHPPTTITRFSSFGILNLKLQGEAYLALKLLCEIQTKIDTLDARVIPPRKLTPRTALHFPEGTVFSVVDQKLLNELLERGRVPTIDR